MIRRSLLVSRIAAVLVVVCAAPVVADDTSSVKVARTVDLVVGAEAEKTADPAPTMSTVTSSAACPQTNCSETAIGKCFNCLSCRACPCVYGDVEALFLQQVPRFQNQPTLVDWNTGATLQSTSDLGFGNTPGLQATFGVRLCNCRAVEFTYFGLFQGNASAVFQKSDPNSIVTFPGGPVGNVFQDMDRIDTNYSSHLNSFELNFPCCCGCCTKSECGCDERGCGEATCTDSDCATIGCGNVRCRSVEWFAGFRYIEIGNDFDMAAQSFPAPFTENGEYTIHTNNRLFGGQLGGRLRGTVNRLGLELTGKAGIYGNSADQSQTVIDFPNFPLRPTTSASGGNVAFEGEINLSGIFRLTDVWSVKAGYNLIWIEGLALAPDQLDFNIATSPSGNQLSTSGGMFLHGANVGLEARW